LPDPFGPATISKKGGSGSTGDKVGPAGHPLVFAAGLSDVLPENYAQVIAEPVAASIQRANLRDAAIFGPHGAGLDAPLTAAGLPRSAAQSLYDDLCHIRAPLTA
jgi:hypothetical protein